MAAEKLSREQRLRKEAQLQSLYIKLGSLRDREASYITASANIPYALLGQISEAQQDIQLLETELAEPDDNSTEARGCRFYREAVEAETIGDFAKAGKLYKSAARYSHQDGNAAARSIRYKVKAQKLKEAAAEQDWLATSAGRSKQRMLLGFVVILILILVVIFAFSSGSSTEFQQAVAADPTRLVSPTLPVVQLIIPDTPTPLPILTATPSPVPVVMVDTPQVVATSPPQTLLPTHTHTPPPAPTRTPVPALKAAPKIVGPKDGLVWNAGAIVFEFQEADLAYDEIYCLNTIRGYDSTGTENWSYAPTGSQKPSVVIEANVFHVAKTLGMKCVTWSAGIGKGTCENIVSQTTVPRVIGLPRPCEFR